MDAPVRVWLVGEQNPYGADPEYALYPYPENSAGGRLCRIIFQMEPRQYLRQFRRVNLLTGKWSAPLARKSALYLTGQITKEDRVIMLGRKVHDAFFQGEWQPFMVRLDPIGVPYLMLPHPSGRNRMWNEPEVLQRAREAVGGFTSKLVLADE